MPHPAISLHQSAEEESWDDNNSAKLANPREPTSPLRIYFSLNPTLLRASDSHPPGSPLTTFLPASPCCVLHYEQTTDSLSYCCMDATSVFSFYWNLSFVWDITCSEAVQVGGCSFPHYSTVPHTHTQTHRTYTLYHVAWRKSWHSTYSTLFFQVDYSSTLHWSLNHLYCSYCYHLMTSWPLLHIHGGLVHLVHSFLFSSGSPHPHPSPAIVLGDSHPHTDKSPGIQTLPPFSLG